MKPINTVYTKIYINIETQMQSYTKSVMCIKILQLNKFRSLFNIKWQCALSRNQAAVQDLCSTLKKKEWNWNEIKNYWN